MALHTDDFMTVLEVLIAIGSGDVEFPVVTKQFITGSDVDIVTVESNAAQAAIRTATFEINIACIPVDMLCRGLRFKIDGENTAVAFALLAAAYDGGRNDFRESDAHMSVARCFLYNEIPSSMNDLRIQRNSCCGQRRSIE